ncbi:MurR/RpiR family transcriptional regulator [uncultured Enorma sp.]|jgi:DNA-binding MurR/RpiR family transcriptional regulator|uniref:MurR/RpiR family transcriptional regulator n=1 Tax=uncultured Enorma sp. TaxID=1714346 RepID=UPI0025DB0F7A|nr:MurR/RpiR family transcriptional regulator [uncultured Enorma sp.]
MFSGHLKMKLQDLSYKENLIANFIMANRASASSMTSYEIAEGAGVAQSAVMRFSKKLGYSSFKELQVDLMYDDPDDSNEVSPEEDTVTTVEKIQRAYQQSVEEMLRLNRGDVLEQIAGAIYRAHRLLCFGAETSLVMARLFSDHMSEIGKDSHASSDLFDSAGFIKNMGPNDLLLIVSASGETLSCVKVAELAKKYSVPMVSITGPHANTVRSMADYELVSSDYKVFTNMVVINNRCSQMFLLECLFLLVWKHNPIEFNKKIQELNQNLDSVAGWPMKTKRDAFAGDAHRITSDGKQKV